MLRSIYIKNYRSLKTLQIASLGNVNLITGKNNTGKSSLLEAIGIYASKANVSFIYQLLKDKGEIRNYTINDEDNPEPIIQAISSLFTDRVIEYEQNNSIEIGEIENTLFGERLSLTQCVSLRFAKELDESPKGYEFSRVVLAISVQNEASSSFSRRIEARFFSILGKGLGETDQYQNLQYINTRNIDRDINAKLWDSIALTDKENDVIEALKIIEPLAERIAFLGNNNNQRSPVLKLSGNKQLVPLKSMGDGINRILTIILALVSADKGVLLIDEFENGLHHSVQAKLWEIIFSLSKKLQVQVFVTTHSNDCIAGFEQILNQENNQLNGRLIRLENKNGLIKQVEFNANELRIATENDIEIR